MAKNDKKVKRPTKYYHFELDIVVTEAYARRWYETTTMKQMYADFESFVKGELCDLSKEDEHAAAQSLHDQCGFWHPVCSWKTLLRRADRIYAC